jgi:hypothetical protein
VIADHAQVSLRGDASDGEFARLGATWAKPLSQFSKWYSKRASEANNFKLVGWGGMGWGEVDACDHRLGSYQLVGVSESPPVWVSSVCALSMPYTYARVC